MRRFLILFMITLLPLRIWAGDAMALEMAFGAASSAVEATTQAVSACHSQSGDRSKVESEASITGDFPNPSGDSMDGRCDTCGACQLCHSVALAVFSFSDLSNFAPPSLLSSDSSGFTSAPYALSFKPPIP